MLRVVRVIFPDCDDGLTSLEEKELKMTCLVSWQGVNMSRHATDLISSAWRLNDGPEMYARARLHA